MKSHAVVLAFKCDPCGKVLSSKHINWFRELVHESWMDFSGLLFRRRSQGAFEFSFSRGSVPFFLLVRIYFLALLVTFIQRGRGSQFQVHRNQQRDGNDSQRKAEALQMWNLSEGTPISPYLPILALYSSFALIFRVTSQQAIFLHTRRLPTTPPSPCHVISAPR